MEWTKVANGGLQAKGGQFIFRIVLRDSDPPYGLYGRLKHLSKFTLLATDHTVEALKKNAAERTSQSS